MRDARDVQVRTGKADENGIIDGLGRVDETAVCLQERRTTGFLGWDTDSTRFAVFRAVPREMVFQKHFGGALSFL